MSFSGQDDRANIIAVCGSDTVNNNNLTGILNRQCARCNILQVRTADLHLTGRTQCGISQRDQVFRPRRTHRL